MYMKEENYDSFASELLKDLKNANIRSFIITIIILIMWFATGCYLVYVLNDIEVITTNEDIIDIDEVEHIDNSDIQIGDK